MSGSPHNSGEKSARDSSVLANDRTADLMNSTRPQEIVFPSSLPLSYRKWARGGAVITLLLVILLVGLTGCGRSPTSLIDQARRLIDEGESAKAVEILNGVVEKNPKDVSALAMRGRALERTDEDDLALRDYNLALELDSTLVDAWEARGRLRVRLKDYDAAVGDLEQAAKLSAQPASIIAAIGLVYFDKENYKQARFYFDKSSALDPNEEGGYFGRAAILIEENNYLA